MRDTPFRTSGRVSGEDFFGRTETIRAVVRNLRGGNNVAIVGAPRSGLSSLLTILFRNYKRAEKESLTWFTDLKELKTLDELVEEFYIATGATESNHSIMALAKVLKGFEKRVVFFIDTGQRFAEPPFNEEALFAVLSTYLASQSISLCLATCVPPERILTNRIGFSLHTQFVRVDLPPFTQAECYELIEARLRFTGIHFTDDDIDKIFQQSGGNPADVQRLSAELFRAKAAPKDEGGPQTAFSGSTRRKR